MDTKLISEKQFLEIKKELDNIMREIDKMAGGCWKRYIWYRS